MKYLKYILVTLILIIPLNIKALSISLSCPANVKSGADFSCTVYGPEYCTEAAFNLELPLGFVYKSNEVGQNYESTGNELNFYFNGNGIHSRVLTIINLSAPKVGVDSKYSVYLKNIKYKYTTEDAEYTIIDDIVKNINVKATKTTTTTTSIKEPSTSKITTKPVITYKAVLDPNGGDLKEQTLSCTTSEKECEINLLNADIPGKEGFVFKGWGESLDCIDGANNNYVLTKDITLYACFEQKVESNPVYLKSLIIKDVDFVFSKFKFNYDIIVSMDVTMLELDAEAVSETAVVSYEGLEELSEGINVIKIIVTDGNNKSEYILNVTRTDENIDANTHDASLKELKIEGYDFRFDPKEDIYTIRVKKGTNELKLNIVPTDNNASYIVSGNENLIDGSIITITVTNEDGLRNYIINIEIDSFFEEYKNYFITVGIITFMLVVYFIMKKQMKEEQKNKNKKSENKPVKKVKEKKIKVKKEKTVKKEKQKKKGKLKNDDQIETLSL